MTELAERYRAVRAVTTQLCAPLSLEDFVVQSMPDASPVKWHLAHTSWFFETFLLEPYLSGYVPFHPQYRVLFNSYYEAVGPQHTRAERGLLTRPTVAEVWEYRQAVDEALLRKLIESVAGQVAVVGERVELGLQHEQQHQELLLTDLQHALSRNPLEPVYTPLPSLPPTAAEPLRFVECASGLVSVGNAGQGFAFDNERPRHQLYCEPFALASRLVNVGEFSEFVRDGGYTRPELWLSDGWAAVQAQAWTAPLYWHATEPRRYSLHGSVPLAPSDPVSHLSFYEADAYARWAGARLPTEQEWELVHAEKPVVGHFAESGYYLPRHTASGFGSVWVWTASPYTAYPRFRPEAGAIGEYNGKFMCNQIVLRGGSCFSPQSHLRASYRNFFPPGARWQATGIRLARDA